MQLKFIKTIILILILFTSHFFYGKNLKTSVTVLSRVEELYEEHIVIFNIFLNKINEVLSLNKDIELFYMQDIIENDIKGSISDFHIRKISNFLFSKNISAFYFVKAYEEKENINIYIILYSSLGSIVFEKDFKVEDYGDDFSFFQKKLKEWEDLIINSEELLLKMRKDRAIKSFSVKASSLNREFPFLSLSLSLISGKLYFDNRTYDYVQKLFSVSPFEIRVTFYPIKFFEVGAFCQFDVNDYVFKYYKKYGIGFFPSYFNVSYGVFLGPSFFIKNKAHFSFGLSVFNIYSDINAIESWSAKKGIENILLPQFSFYQKMDFKIYKILYFTIMLNLKTFPMYYKNEKSFFYSQAFSYDFVVLEMNFIGISIFF